MPDSAVIVAMREFKRDLLAGERAQMQEMATRWLGVERRLSAQIDALAYEMDAIKQGGGTVSREMLMTNVRYRELLGQLTDELEGYTDYAERTISDRQHQLARLGITQAERAIRVQGVRVGFARLPIEAVEGLVGLAGDGTPLANLLAASWPLSAQRLTRELVNGVALGYNPRKTARLMAQGMASSQQRMELISRTETLRVYREANRQSYIRSGVVTGFRRLATHDRRTCAACLMAEGEFYELNEEMPTHPQCRCTLVPIVSGVPAPTWQAGEAWFVEQDQATQMDILGKGRYYAWQNGDYELDELVTVKPNATWGDSLQVTPLRELQSA
jgi:SPP1 gp7 family putative phage head morphogenesis protein